jgi:3-phenylpropionate/trans-cinnamate dioxygenase ferredoxin subunit
MSDFIKVATLDEIPPGGSKLVEVDMVRVALFNLNGDVYAIEDVCTHDGGPLVEGRVVDGSEVQCPRHGARFDIRTGAACVFLPLSRPRPIPCASMVGTSGSNSLSRRRSLL